MSMSSLLFKRCDDANFQVEVATFAPATKLNLIFSSIFVSTYISKTNLGARFLNFCTYLCVLPVVCSCRCVKMERDRQAGVPDASSRLTCVIVYSPPLVSWNRD